MAVDGCMWASMVTRRVLVYCYMFAYSQLYMAVCGYMLSMAVYGCIWLYMAVYGCIWLQEAVYRGGLLCWRSSFAVKQLKNADS